MRGVVEGVRDYGNRMGIPTVNGAVYFDERYLGNPLVYCGNVGLLPRDKSHKRPRAGRSDCDDGRPHGSRWHSWRNVFERRAHEPERAAFRRRGADRQCDRREESARRAARGARSRAVSRGDRLRGGRIQQRGRRDGREDRRGGASRSVRRSSTRACRTPRFGFPRRRSGWCSPCRRIAGRSSTSCAGRRMSKRR